MAVMLAAAMSVGLLSAVPVAAEESTFKIAVGLPDSGSTMFSLMSNSVTQMVEEMGGTVVFQGGVGASADATIQFVEDQIAAGADGIVLSPLADSVLPSVISLCDEAGVYLSTAFRTILDDEVLEMVESSDYYVGRCYEDEEETGYGVMKNLYELCGATKVAIISQQKGNTTTDLREQGALRACEEFGMEIVAEARALGQASDATSATESFLAAYDDLDAVFVVGTTGAGMHEAVAKAIEDAGKSDSVKLATIDFPDSMAELFESGILVTSSGAPSWGYDPYISSVMLVNAIKGTPISEDVIVINIPMFDINNGEAAATWLERFGDAENVYYDMEYVSSTLDKANNPDLNADTLAAIVKDFVDSIEK